MLSAENHEWFNKQSPRTQAILNTIFQEYKLGILEIQDGKVAQAQLIKFDTKEYDVIPLEPDDRIYNRARIKRETRQAFENYFMQGEDDGR